MNKMKAFPLRGFMSLVELMYEEKHSKKSEQYDITE